ncbi:hypothetical protein, partial [Acidithiobacillus thiooxidans]|uniref:hypothetical protein n=1 Tax=Acidithiobacillus thiooxidans TaxID=930 RepID=UPI001C39024D
CCRKFSSDMVQLVVQLVVQQVVQQVVQYRRISEDFLTVRRLHMLLRAAFPIPSCNIRALSILIESMVYPLPFWIRCRISMRHASREKTTHHLQKLDCQVPQTHHGQKKDQVILVDMEITGKVMHHPGSLAEQVIYQGLHDQ